MHHVLALYGCRTTYCTIVGIYFFKFYILMFILILDEL